MKIFSKKRRILFVIILVIFILSLNFFQKEVRNFFYLISSPIQKWFWQTGDSLSDFFTAIPRIKNLERENEEFHLKIQELIQKNIALKELKKENESLRRALNLGLEKEFKLELAQVIGSDISQDLLIINKGLDDGISQGLPLITPQKALVGKIDQVFKNFSKVILTFHKESSFDAKIFGGDLYGVAKGKGSLKISLELIPREKEIKEEDFLITSSLGGIFPANLLVGQIKEIKKSDVEPFQKIEVKPAFEPTELKEVFIITKF